MTNVTKNILWIASYPKSGNTWVRFMVCNLLFGRQESAASLNLLAPDIHEMGSALSSGSYAGLVKTHFLYSSGLPMCNRTAAAIYIVRHPADVLVSNFHYLNRSAGSSDESRAAFDRYFDAFLSNRGDARWINHGMGTWEDNVRSWLGARDSFPVALVKYEDMSADPHGVCRQLARLLRPTCSVEEIGRAVDNSSFRRMREIEDADIRDKRVGIFYKPYLEPAIKSGRRFMREGSVGKGYSWLTDEQRERLMSTFAALLTEMTYPTL